MEIGATSLNTSTIWKLLGLSVIDSWLLFGILLCSSEVVILVNTSIESHHFLSEIDTEVVYLNVFALEEGWQEVFGQAVGVVSIELGELLAISIGCCFFL